MKRFFLDTNVILRFTLRDNVRLTQKARDVFAQAKRGKIELILIPEVIAETVFVLEKVYHYSRTKVSTGLNWLVKSSYLEVRNKREILQTLNDLIITRIDFVDIFLFHLAKNENAQVISFDKDFEKLARL